MKLTALLAILSLVTVSAFVAAVASGILTPLLFLAPLASLFALTLAADYATGPRFVGGVHALPARREAHALAA